MVLAKVSEAMDRAYLRRMQAAQAKRNEPVVVPPSPWTKIIAIALIALCAFGAWQWYTDDTVSDLDKLAAEVKRTEAPDQYMGKRSMERYLLRFGIAILLFAGGYLRLRRSLSS